MKESINKVTKPIFIIGAPRSGTWLLYNIFCNHKDLSYFTLNLLRAGVYRRGRILGYRKKLLARIQNLIHRDKLSVHPHEGTGVWSKYLGTYDYVIEDDCTQEIVDHYLQVVALVQEIFKRPRFVNKNPQHSTRVRVLNRIFPDAKFVHIVRDRTAVAGSTQKASSALSSTNTYFSTLREKIFPLLGDQYYSGTLSEIELYKLASDVLVSRAREAKVFGNDRYYEINYEDLVAEPIKKIKEMLEFSELRNYQKFEDELPEMQNENIKWKNMLR